MARDAGVAAFVLALPLLTYALVRTGTSRLEAVSVALFAGCLALAWRRGATEADRDATERWAVGARAEEATAAALAGLDARRFAVLHDVAVPGRRENADHLVVSRAGVVVVETKRWAGPVVIGRHVRARGERRDEVIDQMGRLERSVRRRLAAGACGRKVPVDLFVCIHTSRVRPARWRRRARLGRVAFGSPDDLVRWLRRRRRRRAVLDRGAVAEVTRALARGPSAVPAGDR